MFRSSFLYRQSKASLRRIPNTCLLQLLMVDGIVLLSVPLAAYGRHFLKEQVSSTNLMQ